MRARPSWRLAVCENRVTDPQFISRLAHLSIMWRSRSVVLWAALSTLFVMEINCGYMIFLKRALHNFGQLKCNYMS